jgi:putative ABC transport system permease protein
LQQDERIKTVVPWFYLDKNIIRNEKDGSAQRIFATVYDGNMDDIGMINIRGRNPVEDNEVSIGINTSRKTIKM